MTRKTGPRDVAVSWAIVCFFVFLYLPVLLAIYSNYYDNTPNVTTPRGSQDDNGEQRGKMAQETL